jgi:hypothetical protein
MAARSIEQLQVMAIESGNSIRELYPEIGIPVTTKSVLVVVGASKKRSFIQPINILARLYFKYWAVSSNRAESF